MKWYVFEFERFVGINYQSLAENTTAMFRRNHKTESTITGSA